MSSPSPASLPPCRLWLPAPAGPQVSALSVVTDARGRIARLQPSVEDSSLPWAVPGVANLHSHAFQRAMAGLAERRLNPQDSFWTWRETMYQLAARFDPDSLRDVAAQLYAEMLEAGYTRVCEFHYLHHAPDGRPYADPAAMSRALIEAARETGIGLTLLPVLYMTGGFDGRALSERQRRFGHSIDAYMRLLDTLRAEENERLRIGCALHSLRAVPPDAMREVLAALPGDSRIHIHIAEQTGEVEECVALRGARPVEWLYANAEVDARWTLVHATHLSAEETRAIAHSGATVAICTTTEANLGDGLFPLLDFMSGGGRFGVGSDSHASVSLVEELRWLEYGQRLLHRHRTLAVDAGTRSVGESLLAAALRAGADSAGQGSAVPGGVFATGADADLVTLQGSHPALHAATAADVIDRWLFASNRPAIDGVWVGGLQRVSAGRHLQGEAIEARFAATLKTLLLS
ncbi:formimidoylglutamate deiminase [Aquimonas voraii]